MRHVRSLLFLFILLLFSIQTPTVYAQEMQNSQINTKPAPDSFMPPAPPDINPILGQEHAYSVLFRGNGEAIVSMRTAFLNEKETPMNTLTLRLPRVAPRRTAAFQILREPECLRYKPYTPVDMSGAQPACLQYQEPNYFRPWGQAKYQKATVLYAGDTLTVTLPQAVKPNKSGSVIIVFSANGYVKKNIFGAYNYTFETLKVEDAAINTLTLGISVDTDLYLAGGTGIVNYRFSDTEAITMAAQAEKSAVAMPQLDQLSGQIGYGMITKTASHLSPLESYTVSGRYADSILRLYAKGILMGVALFIACASLFVFLGRFAFKKLVHNTMKDASTRSPMDTILLIAGSFVAASMITALTAGLFFLRNAIQNVMPYTMIGTVLILATVISVGAYGLFLITPAVIMGIRRGPGWGLGAFGLTVFFLIIQAVFLILTLVLLYGNAGGPIIYPMMNRLQSEAKQSGGTSIRQALPMASPGAVSSDN